LERLHAGVLTVLQSTLRLSALDVDSVADASPYEIQGLLDSVSQVLNNRPIATLLLDMHDCNRHVVTPNFLVYGSVSDDVIRAADGPFHKGYLAWREFYDGYYWKKLKSLSARAIADRMEPIVPAVNELILVYSPASKSQIAWKVARVVDIRGNLLVVEQKGICRGVSIHNCTRLRLHSSEDRGPTDVRFIGARVRTLQEGMEYHGTVINDNVLGQVLIRWDIVDETSWPDEWRDWPVD
jgi:hypothetical protein